MKVIFMQFVELCKGKFVMLFEAGGSLIKHVFWAICE